MWGTPKTGRVETGTRSRLTGRTRWRLAALLGLAHLASCDGSPVATRLPDRITIAVPVAAGRLSVGEITILQATVSAGNTPVSAADVAWSSSAPSVIAVAPGGLITAVARGTAEITASVPRSPDVTATVILSVVGATTLKLDTRAVTMDEGGQRRLNAAVAYDAGAMPSAITWRSSVPSVALVDHQGLVTALAAGTTVIRASASGLTDSAVITVSPQPVGSITIDSTSSTTLFLGDRRSYTATVRSVSGAILSGRPVIWSTVDPSVATVTAAGLVTAVGAGTTTLSAESDGKVAERALTVRFPAATVVLSPSSLRVPRGLTGALAAEVRNAAGVPLTDRRSVSWSSSAPLVAIVSADGAITGVANGTATITATVEGVSGTATVAVVDPVSAVLVTPATATLVVRGTQQLTASARDAKGAALTGRPVVWSSSNAAVATVSAAGVVTGIAAGSANITATVEGIEAVATVTVVQPVATVQVSPPQSNLFVGRTLQVTASARDASGAALTGRAVTWSSSDPTVATITATGLVTAVAAGSVTITATVEGIEGTASFTIVPLPAGVTGVTVAPTTVSLFTGRTRTITATVSQPAGAPTATVTYGSAEPTVATVSNTGVITGVAAGTATITVTATAAGNANVSAATQTATVEVTVEPMPVASVQITPGTTNLIVGGTQQLVATVRDSTGAALTGRVATWSSSNTAVATVNATGLVTAVSVGSATLTVTVEGARGTALVSVAPLPAAITSLTVSPNAQNLIVGQTRAITPVVVKPAAAPVATLTYGTTAPDVATVSSTGVITAVAPGTAIVTVTATAAGNTSFSAATMTETVLVTVAAAVASVQVSPGTASLMAGTTQQLTTTVRDSTGALLTGRSVAWTTSSASVATVNASGLVTAVAVGTATITATVGGVPGTATITVASLPPSITDVTLSPTTASLLAGRTLNLSPTVTQPVGAATAAITYGTTAPSVATVSAAGVIAAVAPGTATITVTATAAANTGFAATTRTATITVTVSAAAVASVLVAPGNASVLTGSTQPLVATVRDSAGQVLTGRTVSWATLNAAAASVSATGIVTGVAVGTATITATVEGVVGSGTITVLQAPAAVTSVSASPSAVTLGIAQTRAISPTVTQPTGATGATVTYGTTDPAVATVSAAGVISAVATGTATITVTATAPASTGFSAATTSTTVSVTVVPMAITTLTVSPTTATLTAGQTQALTPTVTQPIGAPTAAVTYATSAPGVATVSPSGVVTAVGPGTATITVTAAATGNASFAAAVVTTTMTVVVTP